MIFSEDSSCNAKTQVVSNTQVYYKGFNSNLECKYGSHSMKYEVGQEYETLFHSASDKQPRLCSNDGLHFCKDIRSVFSFYSLSNTNRFCIVEPIGRTVHNSDKSITTKIKIVRELTYDEIIEILVEEYFDLDLVKRLQTKYPLIHIGGSLGLFLHGIRLKRWSNKKSSSDLDIVAPFYFVPTDSKEDDMYLDFFSEKSSGNDFDFTFSLNGTLVDVKIDPMQRYELITYKGFTYKVSNLLTIIEAKLKYAKTNTKHKQDLLEIMLKEKYVK